MSSTGGSTASALAMSTRAEHDALRDAILAGNADLAAALQYAHIEGARAPTLAALRATLPA